MTNNYGEIRQEIGGDIAKKKFEYIRRREICSLFQNAWINYTKPMLNLMSRTQSKSAKDLESLRISCARCRWKKTMQYLLFAAGCAQHLNAKRFWMVCNMVHTLCVNLVHREDNYV